MQTLSFYVQTIQDAYPYLSIHTLRMHNNGQNSDVLVVNDELIFRFPRYPEGVAALATEVAVLAHIQHAVPIPVPDPLYTGSDMHTIGGAFMGYRMLLGEPLWQKTVAAVVYLLPCHPRVETLIKSYQLFSYCQQRRLCPILQVQLAQNVADVCFHGALADYQLVSDLGVGHAARDQRQHIALALR